MSNFGSIGATGTNGIGVELKASGSTLTNAGTITGASGTAVAFAGGNNRVIVDPGAAFTGIVNGGTANDTLELGSAAGTGTLSGFGTTYLGFTALSFDPGATWLASGGAAGLGAASITGFAQGDTIDLTGLVANGDTYAGGILTLTNNATVVANLTLSTPITNPLFTLGTDGSGGTLIGVTTQINYTGTYTGGIVLSNPTVQNPTTVTATGYVTNTTTAHNGDAVYGTTAAAWNFTNLGTLNATGALSDGVFLSAGGTVTNGASGSASALIEGYDGVRISGPSSTPGNFGTILNFGTIESTGIGFGAQAVDLLYGGRLVNYGTILGLGTHASGINAGFATDIVINGAPSATGALIEGWLNGIDQFSSLGTVNNFGTVESTNSDGVYLQAGGTVTNGASLSTAALISAPQFGVKIQGTGTVINYGSITASSDTGVWLNAGSITNGASGSTAASISGSFDGVFIAGGAGTVLNYGTVTGGYDDGVCLYEGGILTNGASGATAGLIAGYAWGVEVHNSAGTVINFATIESTGAAASASGVDLLAGGTVTNQQSGLIQGSDGVYVASGTVVNSGTIQARSVLACSSTSAAASPTAQAARQRQWSRAASRA